MTAVSGDHGGPRHPVDHCGAAVVAAVASYEHAYAPMRAHGNGLDGAAGPADGGRADLREFAPGVPVGCLILIGCKCRTCSDFREGPSAGVLNP